MIHDVGDGYIGDVVRFYGELEKTKSQIDGLQLGSYPTISPEGSAFVVQRLFERCRECEEIGRELLSEMAQAHADLRLTRKMRRAALGEGDLPAQMRRLASDYDRIRAKHGEPPN